MTKPYRKVKVNFSIGLEDFNKFNAITKDRNTIYQALIKRHLTKLKQLTPKIIDFYRLKNEYRIITAYIPLADYAEIIRYYAKLSPFLRTILKEYLDKRS